MGRKNVIWNDYISINERFADFVNGIVFQGREIVLPESLMALDTKLWRRQHDKNSYHEYVRDVVKVWEYQGSKYILSLEPEESPHYALPVKYMNYESVEYDRQYKEILRTHRKKRDLSTQEYLSGFAETDALMQVITIGIYLGEKKWSGFTYLSEMTGRMGISKEISDCLNPFCNNFHANLIDIHQLETSDVFRTDLREVFGFLSLRGDNKALRCYVEENEEFRHLKEDAYDVLSVYAGMRELEIKKENYRTEGMNMDMCTAVREWKEEAIMEGRTEGRAEGQSVMNKLIYCLIKEGRTEELFRSSRDSEYQKKLMKEYGIELL